MQLAAARRLESWAASWARRRQGNDSHTVVLRRRRIYILPTRFGVVFALMIFAMLLGSLNYGASLGFMLTFLLASLALVLMHHCHGNLLGVEVRLIGAHPVFAGQRAEFRVALRNDTAAPRYELELAHEKHVAGPIDIAPGAQETLRIAVPTEHRGWTTLERFAAATRHPGALFRAWTWVHMDARCLVYPQPAAPGRPLPDSAGVGLGGRPDRGDSDFAGLRAAAPGDPPQRIAWKAFARSDALLLKQFAGGDREPCELDWKQLPDLGPEARLAQLARWCLDAAGEARSFSLNIPGATLPLGAGPQHLALCLEALALCETGEP